MARVGPADGRHRRRGQRGLLLVRELLEELERGRGGCLVVERRGEPPTLPSVPVGVRSTVVRASVDEQLVAYAALAELCSPLLPLIQELPPVQARALQGALALGPPGGDALAVAAGFRSLLLLAAERQPILVIVEDAHLLDRGTAAALAYACRRLDGAAVGIVVIQDPDAAGSLDLPGARRAREPEPGGEPRPQRAHADLDGALDRAHQRGSLVDIAAALEAIAAASTDGDRADALLGAGQAWLDSGQVERASAVATQARALRAGCEHAARAELLLGRIHAVLGNGRQSALHLEAAVEQAGDDSPEVAAAALLLLMPAAMFAGRIDDAQAALDAARHRIAAATLPEGDPLHQMLTAGETALALATGRSTDIGPILELADAVAADASSAGDLSLLVTTVALPLIWVERQDVAVPLLHGLIGALRRSGAIGALPMPLCALSVAERRAGRPTRALIFASEAKDLAEHMGHRVALLFAYSELANTHGLFGDVDRCRASAQVVLDAGGSRTGAFRTSALSALATVELWSGDPVRVIELLEPLIEAGSTLAPSVTLFHHSLLAAYVAVGRRDDASVLLGVIESSAPLADGRLRATVARCGALLAPHEDRDACFERAIERAGDQQVVRGQTRLLYARRLLADGEVSRGATLLSELSEERDENLLGVARAARLTLTRLGMVVASGDPAWAQLGPEGLEVALSAADQVPVLSLADRLRLSPPEVERLRDDLLAVLGARSGPEVAAAMHRSAHEQGTSPRAEIRLLGGLRVLVNGEPIDLPTGAASTAVALVALRRAVHVEELTDVLWPEASPEVARRRLRNVLTRVRQAAGPIVLRHGERVELAAEVVVDHHVLETSARRALAAAPGPGRVALLEAAVEAHRDPFLPEAIYEEWTQSARWRAEARGDELVRALEEALASG